MINPSAIPQFTGNLEQLEGAADNLKTDAGKIRGTGADVHSKFQGLSAYYKAPEAEQLFATTQPVADKADAFGDDLEKVSTALTEFAGEVRPLVAKLTQLKTDAAAFVEMTKEDDDWQYDGDKVEEHNQLRDDVTATVAAFWAAERTCHNKITALFGGTQMVAGDGSDRKDQYGFNAEDMKNAKLPWGDPVEEKHHWYEVGHWVKSFVWDGLIVDGVWGTIKGLGTLVGFQGWDAFKQAWTGLGKLATGLALTSLPIVGTAFWALPDDKLPSWIRDSRTAMKQTGKALVAWDEWGKNPARAAGAVTFNVVTTVFTGGAGAGVSGAGKAGAISRVLSAAGKAGRFIDPMTYIMKGAGAGLSKMGDVMAGLKGVGNIEVPRLPEGTISLPEGAVRLPEGTVRLPDGAAIPDGAVRIPEGGAVHLPEGTPIPAGATDLGNGAVKLPDGAAVPDGAVKLPEGTVKLADGTVAVPDGAVKLPTEAGAPAQYLDNQGNILDGQGNVVQQADQAPKSVGDTPRAETPARIEQPQPALVGAGANVADNVASVGGVGDNLGDIGRAGDDLSGGAGRIGDAPGGIGNNMPGGVAGNMPTNSVDNAVPGTSVGDNVPAGGTHTPSNNLDNGVPVRDTADPLPRSDGPGSPEAPGSSAAGHDAGRIGDDAIGDSERAADETGDAADGQADNGSGAGDQDATSTDPDTTANATDDANPYSGREPDFSRPMLPPGDGPLSLADVRNMRDPQARWQAGEELHRQVWGGGPERHYPVPMREEGRYPVTTPGGRKVDVPVDLPGGRTVAVEVKTYGEYKTITLDDGTKQAVKNEVPLSKGIKEQIHKDIALREMDPGYDPRWSFTHAGPSKELREYLTEAKIIFMEYGPAPKKG